MNINSLSDLKAKFTGNVTMPKLPSRLSKKKKRPAKMSRRKKFGV